MSDLAIFSYLGTDVRVLTIDESPRWVAADVARILGINNPRMAVARLDEDDVSLADVIDSMGRPQRMSVLNESALYEMILRSDKPDAKQFRKWVTSVVLPEIRQTGSYIAAPAVREVPQDFASALREYAAEIESHEVTRAALDVAQPRADAWDAIASAEGDYSVGDAAKMLVRAGIPTGPTRLFNTLNEIKWTFRGEDGRPRAYAERVEKGYLAEKPSFHYHPGTGEKVVDPPQVRVTLKGIERLRQRLHIGALKAVAS